MVRKIISYCPCFVQIRCDILTYVLWWFRRCLYTINETLADELIYLILLIVQIPGVHNVQIIIIILINISCTCIKYEIFNIVN